MTFPDWFTFPDKKKDADRLIGNAVPPAFIETVVRRFFDEHPGILE